ncbi:hypothetical protein [Streptomyces chattanoogensis]|uniref:hypothetical protein n=1 Tax=Streptomyces chattanoogensis TaxID=66876 RepID=UPI0036C3BE09
MSADHIDPSKIPSYTGNLEELEARAKALKKEAGAIRDKGADIHADFQGLRAYYTAPEAEQLFATTKPVAKKADVFADELEKVGAALDGFAAEVRPLVAKLHQLKGMAAEFAADIKDDEDWQYNPGKVAWSNRVVQEVKATVQAFWAAEVAAANKITALVDHGTHWSLGDGSKKGGHTYGLTKKVMMSAGDTPWGKIVDEKYHWYDPRAVVSWVKHFIWDGTVVDGAWATLKGLGTLLNPWGDNFGAAWKSMGHLFTGLTFAPLAGFIPLLPDGGVKTWMKDSMKTTVEVGKSLVAWDQWSKDSGRAAGAATFNIATALFTRGAGGAAKTGAEAAGVGAKIANAAGKVGRVGQLMDPTTHIITAAGAAAKFTKLDAALGSAFKTVKTAAALSHLRDAFAVTGRTSPSGEIHLPNGQAVDLHGPLPDLPPGKTFVYLPDGAGKVPPGSFMEDANTFLTPGGKVIDAHGMPKKGFHAVAEGSAKDREILNSIPPERAAAPTDHELATVGAEHRHHGMANAGDGHAPRGDLRPHASHQPSEAGGVGSRGPGGPTPSGGTHTQDTASPGGHGPGGVQGAPHQGGNGDGPSGGHDGPGSSDVESEGRRGTGGGDGSGTPDQSPVHLEGDRLAQRPSGEMPTEQEAAVTDALKDFKVPPVDQERMLTQLRKSEYGAAVADYIESRRFADIPEYKELLFQVKQKGMMPAVHQAFEHAAELQDKGIGHIEFELKLPEQGLDLDVLTRVDGRIEYGAQLKDVKSANGIKSAVAGIVEKQLAGSGVDVKAAILDVHDLKGAVTERILRLVRRAADRTNASFELRFDDGSITVYPTNATKP